MHKEGLVARQGSEWASTEKDKRRRLPRWLGGYEVTGEALRWDPALGRLVAAG
jgi:hypothetical protein